MSFIFVTGKDGKRIAIAKHTAQEAKELRDFQDYFRARYEGTWLGNWKSWKIRARTDA